MARVIKQRPMNWVERLYIFEAIRGLWTTLKHAARGLFRYEELPTISYPEGQPEVRRSYRAKHVFISKRPPVTIRASKRRSSASISTI